MSGLFGEGGDDGLVVGDLGEEGVEEGPSTAGALEELLALVDLEVEFVDGFFLGEEVFIDIFGYS